ncbi:unnamed protein product, partial [marine sediment metagenome]
MEIVDSKERIAKDLCSKFKKELSDAISLQTGKMNTVSGEKREKEIGCSYSFNNDGTSISCYITGESRNKRSIYSGFFAKKTGEEWGAWRQNWSIRLALVYVDKEIIKVSDKRALKYFKDWGEKNNYKKLERGW